MLLSTTDKSIRNGKIICNEGSQLQSELVFKFNSNGTFMVEFRLSAESENSSHFKSFNFRVNELSIFAELLKKIQNEVDLDSKSKILSQFACSECIMKVVERLNQPKLLSLSRASQKFGIPLYPMKAVQFLGVTPEEQEDYIAKKLKQWEIKSENHPSSIYHDFKVFEKELFNKERDSLEKIKQSLEETFKLGILEITKTYSSP